MESQCQSNIRECQRVFDCQSIALFVQQTKHYWLKSSKSSTQTMSKMRISCVTLLLPPLFALYCHCQLSAQVYTEMRKVFALP